MLYEVITRRLLLRYNRATEDEIKVIEDEVAAEVKVAHKKGLMAPHPTPESIHDFVIPSPYVSEKYPDGTHTYEGEPKKLIEGLNETLKAEFRHNPDTYIWGQDIVITSYSIHYTKLYD